jgi:hypothetical protein
MWMMLWVPCVRFHPPQAPEATQAEAPVVDQLRSVVPSNLTDVGFAEKLTVGPVEVVVDDVTVTEALFWTVPPLPTHVSEYVALWVSPVIALLPDVAWVPAQPPEAVQLVALAELHCNVVCPPEVTLVGLAVKESVGAAAGGGVTGTAVTVTATDWLTEPPAPEQANTKLELADRGPTDWLPEVALVPLHPPLAVQEVAFAVLHVRVTDEPDCTLLAFDASVSVGAGAGGGGVVPPEPLPDPLPDPEPEPAELPAPRGTIAHTA